MMFSNFITTPLGEMLVCGNDKEISLLEFTNRKNFQHQIDNLQKYISSEIIKKDLPIFSKVQNQLNEYFKGERTQFDIPLQFFGTDFQKSVWEILMQIPYGKTFFYAQQAELLGDKKKVRAVANANGKNKIAIIVPCHRVIGSNGKLTGYAGGLWRKEKLLALEKK